MNKFGLLLGAFLVASPMATPAQLDATDPGGSATNSTGLRRAAPCNIRLLLFLDS